MVDLRIGIDLGTTNTSAAFYSPQGPQLINLDAGGFMMPSVVSYENGEWLVGSSAARAGRFDDVACYRNFKRLINAPMSEAQDLGELVEPGPDGTAMLSGPERLYKPSEMSSFLLRHVKRCAEEQLGRTITGAVIGVPADFEETERELTKEAGRSAGFEQVDLITEPLAAAFAYGIDIDKWQTIAVYDFGGGTLDVSILEVAQGHHTPLHRDGLPHLGGINFDQRLLEHVISKQPEEAVEVIRNSHARQRLLLGAESTKIELSNRPRARFNEGHLGDHPTLGTIHMDEWVSVGEFEALVKPLVDQTLDICANALAQADRKPQEIKHVLLVGGMTRVPMVRRAVETFFGRAPENTHSPQQIVAVGAAIEAARLDNRSTSVSRSDVVQETISVERPGGALLPIITRGETLPCAKAEILTSLRDDQPHLSVRIYEGEALAADDEGAELIAEHDFPLPPAAKRTPEIGLVADMDESGALYIELRDTKAEDDPVVILGAPQ